MELNHRPLAYKTTALTPELSSLNCPFNQFFSSDPDPVLRAKIMALSWSSCKSFSATSRLLRLSARSAILRQGLCQNARSSSSPKKLAPIPNRDNLRLNPAVILVISEIGKNVTLHYVFVPAAAKIITAGILTTVNSAKDVIHN